MNLENRIKLFTALGNSIKNDLSTESFETFLEDIEHENSWFIRQFVRKSLGEIADNYLNKDKLTEWLSAYTIENRTKKVGLILAGNLPLVGFHDILSVLICGHVAVVKLSTRDKLLYHYIRNTLIELEPQMSEYFILSDSMKEVDAIIATGSDNSSKYFEYYFAKKPHIIRRNRVSVAVLTGSETTEELSLLSDDIFSYFGLGCRSVSKIYIPKNYNVSKLIDACNKYEWLGDYSKYNNNYTYNKSVLLVNKEPHFDSGFSLFRESEEMHSPISVVFLKSYENISAVEQELIKQKNKLQVIVSNREIDGIPTYQLGFSQKPQLNDYADGIDTLQFLTTL